MKVFKITFLMLAMATFVSTGCKDKCKDVTCLNGGVCNEGNCDCPSGTSGSDCGTLDRAKFIGTYEGETVVSSTGQPEQSFDSEIVITSGSGMNKIEIESTQIILGQETTTEETATVNGSSFTLSTSTDEGETGGIEYELTTTGSGDLNGTTLTIERNTDGTTTFQGVESDYNSTSITTAEKQ